MTPRRVVAYATRDGRLLVFEAEDVEGPHVPAGRGEPGESLEQTPRREPAFHELP